MDNASISSSEKSTPSQNTLWRLAQYILTRLVVLGLMLATGIYLAVIVANFGGFVDDMMRANIDEAIQFTPRPPDLTDEQAKAYFDNLRVRMIEAAGLNQPFLLRSARWAWRAAIFDWGNSYRFRTLDGVKNAVKEIVKERLAITLLLFGVANFLMFIASIATAFTLYRHFGGKLDRLMTNLSVISSIPNWMIGAILTVIFAYQLRWLPFSGILDAQAYDTSLAYALGVVRHMVLPVSAIFLGLFFQSVAAWRALFLMQEAEDYMEVARAKGLPEHILNTRYLLRPTLPYIVTSLAMLMVGVWQSSIAVEVWFGWPGVGQLLFRAIGGGNLDRNIVLAVIVVFAYILAATVFLLDLVYAFLDPRVKVGGSQRISLSSQKRKKSAQTNADGHGMKAVKTWFSSVRSTVISIPLNWRFRLPARPTIEQVRHWQQSIRRGLYELGTHPSSVVAIVYIIMMIGIATYTVTQIPYERIVPIWRPDLQNWYKNPANAKPAWFNWFNGNRLPTTIKLDSQSAGFPRQVQPAKNGGSEISLSYRFDFPYGEAPQDLALFWSATYEAKKPFILLKWLTPDGRTIDLGSFSIVNLDASYLTGDKRLQRRYGKDQILTALFTNPDTSQIVKGTYELQVTALTFEPDNDVNAEMIAFGQAYGWAGTDNRRRDLTLALLWGTPVALAFGILGALLTSVTTIALAAAGSWFGGWVDGLIQRLTEISMILPTIPIAMTVFFLYSKTIWAILGTIVVLSIFGSGLKNYRAALLQIKESPYIEAARAYGASDWRIIRQYMLPRILPILLPQFMVQIPAFIFLETTLAFLGVSDIYLPTWGKVMYEALESNALQGNAYWILQPLALLLSTGLAFTILGLNLDRWLNPRLRVQ
jgi:peptide/nickel transport system permease protein